jgi:hypothetical protein
MNLRDRNTVMRIGMVFLILASCARYFFRAMPQLGDAWTGGLTGLLYGLAIGTLLLSIRLRPSSCAGSR